MARRNLVAYVANGTGFSLTGPGQLLAVMIAHVQVASAAAVATFYNNTAASGTILTVIAVAPEQTPRLVEFPRDMPLLFTTGLAIAAANCYVTIWYSQ